jgi:hypothetical protein
MATRETRITLINATGLHLVLQEEHHCHGEWSEGRGPAAGRAARHAAIA